MKSENFVYTDQCEWKDLGNGTKRKVLAWNEAIMQCLIEFDEGAAGEPHSHPHDQISTIISGVFRYTVGDETKTVRAGDTVLMPANVVHGCVCLEKGSLLDTFAPYRETFV